MKILKNVCKCVSATEYIDMSTLILKLKEGRGNIRHKTYYKSNVRYIMREKKGS